MQPAFLALPGRSYGNSTDESLTRAANSRPTHLERPDIVLLQSLSAGDWLNIELSGRPNARFQPIAR